MPVTFTTELPDVSQIDSLDNGIEDEVTVHWPDAIDNGQYEVDYKESSSSTWVDGATVSERATNATIGGLEDGEEYDFRLRTRTEHVTGEWTATATITTNFPSPTNPSASLSSSSPLTEVDLSFDDHADNEDGVRVLRQREYDYGWGPWQEVKDLGPNAGTGTVAAVDDTVSPDNTYRYKFEAYTEDATNTSTTTSAVTTDASGRPRERTGSKGWEVKVEHPTAGPIRPRLLDDPSFKPALRDYPRVEIPIPRDEKWQATAFEDADLSVWKDGRIRPIDTLVDVRMELGRTVLVGKGGRELEDRVQAEFDDEAAHLAAEQLGQNNTSYQMNVDDPSSSTSSNTVMQSAETNSELRDALATPIAETDPVEIADGRLNLLQSCFPSEGLDRDRGSGVLVDEDPAYSGGQAAYIAADGAKLEFDITPDYDIPASAVGVQVRDKSADTPEVTITLNGDTVDVVPSSGGSISLGWSDLTDGRYSGDGYTGGTLSAGTTYTLTLKVTTAGSNDAYLVDHVAVYDTRFNYNFDDDNGGAGGYLAGPELKPDAFEVLFADVPTAFNVTAGEIVVAIDDTSGAMALDLSNDGGANWAGPAANTANFEMGFASAGSSIRWRLSLSRYGSQTDATPTQGIHGQSLDSFTLRADLEDTPVLDAFKIDGSLKDGWNDIARYGNFIWSLERDENGWRVEWTQPGQRTTDVDEDLADYQVDKSTEYRYKKAIIKGGNQPVVGEQFTTQHDSWVALDQSELVSGSDIVRDPDSGATYELGIDYELDRTQGRIKVLSGGGMADGSVSEIDYEYKPVGSYTAPDAGSDPKTIVRTRPGLASNRACDQAALYLIQRVQEPRWSAEVTVPHIAGMSLVDAVAWTGLPTRGERVEIQDIQQAPGQTVLHLGNWESPGAVLDDFAQRISENATRA